MPKNTDTGTSAAAPASPPDLQPRIDELTAQIETLKANLAAAGELTEDERGGYRLANRTLVEARVNSFCPNDTRWITAFLAKLESILGKP